MINLSPTASRLVALGLLMLLFLLFLFYLLMPLVSRYYSQYEDVAFMKQRLYRLEQLVELDENFDQAVDQATDEGSGSDIFVEGGKVAIASANLRELVSETVKNAGGQLLSSREYEVESNDSATPVGLRVTINGEIDNLVEILYGLENNRPLLFVEGFGVSSKSSKVRSAQGERLRGSRRSTQGSLDIRLEIVGYLPGDQI